MINKDGTCKESIGYDTPYYNKLKDDNQCLPMEIKLLRCFKKDSNHFSQTKTRHYQKISF